VDPNTDWASAVAVNALKSEWAQIATNAMHHPATLGYVIGNELNAAWWNPSLSSLWSALNSVAGEIRRHDTNHLVTTALSDSDLLGHIANNDAVLTNFNAWCVQVYRGDSFKTLFTDYAAASAKPLFITEFGLDAHDVRTGQEYPANAQVQADWTMKLWNELVANTNVASGGAVFAWCDEWWKAGNAALHNSGGWANGAFPDGQADEEWWGINRVAPGTPNGLEPRAAFAALRTAWFVTPGAARLEAAALAGGDIRVSVSGSPGFSYALERSPDFTNWTAVATNPVPFLFGESVTGSARRFYRAVTTE
jgi:hypothetical protein